MVTDSCDGRRMTIDEHTAAGKSEYNGKTYYFCALGCKAKFDANPSASQRSADRPGNM